MTMGQSPEGDVAAPGFVLGPLIPLKEHLERDKEISWHHLDEFQPADDVVISRGVNGLKLYMVAPFLMPASAKSSVLENIYCFFGFLLCLHVHSFLILLSLLLPELLKMDFNTSSPYSPEIRCICERLVAIVPSTYFVNLTDITKI